MPHVATPSVPVSWGELIDKITILEIKRARLRREDARRNVAKEHALLRATAAEVLNEVAPLVDELKAVNERLWDIEDAIRGQEAAARFGDDFIHLARQVYRRNDERAAIKRRINERLDSGLMEEKGYADYC